MNKNIKLYIVKENDTLDSIAQKNNCSKEEILKLNTLINNKIHTNQPLLIPIIHDEENLERHCNINKNKVVNLLFYIKETLFSSLFCIDYFDILKEKTNHYLQELNNNVNISKFINKLLLFPILLNKKNEKLLMEYEASLSKDLNEIDFQQNDIFSQSSLKYLSDQFQLYLLKVGNKCYNEAEKIFTDILNIDFSLI